MLKHGYSGLTFTFALEFPHTGLVLALTDAAAFDYAQILDGAKRDLTPADYQTIRDRGKLLVRYGTDTDATSWEDYSDLPDDAQRFFHINWKKGFPDLIKV